uniref:Uncharacterized protein n=1 Tax=Oryza meridionalis TaxID=40149 RepID=A0A0E0EYD4_9ORYZ
MPFARVNTLSLSSSSPQVSLRRASLSPPPRLPLRSSGLLANRSGGARVVKDRSRELCISWAMEKAAAAACGWRKGLEEGEPEWEAMELEAAAPAIFPADGGGGGGRRSPAAWRIYFNQHMRMTSTICYKGPKMKQAWTNDFIPKDGCKRGPRGARKRQTFPSRGARARRAFPLQQLCFGTTRDKRCRLRKNNDHWTIKEVTNLVQGVSKHGVGRWTELKRDFFSTSIRTSVHLKDKWRNLLKACGIDFTSTAKGNAQKTMLWPLDKRLIEQITQLAYKHPYPRQKY